MKRIDGDQSSHVRAIRSKLLTFNNLEKLIPQKQNSLNNYFAELKRRCLWLKKHPHYWVQYAMCRLSFGDTKIAQEHLDSAYKFASLRKDDYHTENIDTQQARLFIMKAIENISDPANAAKLFENANKLLNSIKNDNQKFRQVIKYQGIYESLHHLWRPKKQVMFEQACKAMKAEANLAFDIALPTERTKFIEQCKVVLTEILEDIVKKRGSLQ
jgi:tetratricopeptide (TPR) repeat protein